MELQRHGLSFGIERTGQDYFMWFRVRGELTHKDYQDFTPILNAALDQVDEPRVTALVDIVELEAWDARATWDDFKIALKHGREFEKVAVVGNRRWQEIATQVAGWFVAGSTEFFEDESEALGWLIKLDQARKMRRP